MSDTCLPFVPGMSSHTGPITDVPVEAIAVDGSVSTFMVGQTVQQSFSSAGQPMGVQGRLFV